MEIKIYSRFMKTREKAHAHIARRLSFPKYYGKNLDALHDMLTERGEKTEIIIKGSERLRESMDGYGARIIKVFLDSAEENPNITVTLK